MPRVCTACNHPQRDAIDLALLTGEPYRRIAAQFDLSEAAVRRHKDHLPGQLAKAHEAAESVSAGTLLDRLRQITSETHAVLKASKQGKNPELSLKAIARLERQLELEARMLGELKENEVTVNIYSTPEWIALRAIVITALQPFPEASRAVGKALSEHSE